jgi:hypothetical protein
LKRLPSGDASASKGITAKVFQTSGECARDILGYQTLYAWGMCLRWTARAGETGLWRSIALRTTRFT